MTPGKIIETLAAAILFSGAFVLRGRMLRHSLTKSTWLSSFGGGVGVAYVFVHLWPQLDVAREVFLEHTARLSWQTKEHSLYLATMCGFVIFYGLQKYALGSGSTKRILSTRSRFFVLLGMFGTYAFLVAYLLLHPLEEGLIPLEFYAAALGLHFALIANALHQQYGARYDGIGSWVLAGFVMAGWAVGLLIDVPKAAVVLLLAWVAGAVIVNTLTIDLPSEQEGRFLPFVAGAVFYTTLLLAVY